MSRSHFCLALPQKWIQLLISFFKNTRSFPKIHLKWLCYHPRFQECPLCDLQQRKLYIKGETGQTLEYNIWFKRVYLVCQWMCSNQFWYLEDNWKFNLLLLLFACFFFFTISVILAGFCFFSLSSSITWTNLIHQHKLRAGSYKKSILTKHLSFPSLCTNLHYCKLCTLTAHWRHSWTSFLLDLEFTIVYAYVRRSVCWTIEALCVARWKEATSESHFNVFIFGKDIARCHLCLIWSHFQC